MNRILCVLPRGPFCRSLTWVVCIVACSFWGDAAAAQHDLTEKPSISLARRVRWFFRYISHEQLPHPLVIDAMRAIPRSKVAPHDPQADMLCILKGVPKMSNPIGVARQLTHIMELPHGAHVLELGTGCYSTALLARLAAQRSGKVTTLDKDLEALTAAMATIDELKRKGILLPKTDWQPMLEDAGNLLRSPGFANAVDRIVFQFAVPAAEVELLPQLTKLLKPRGHLVVPVIFDSTNPEQYLWLMNETGRLTRTQSLVSFEPGTLDNGT